MKYKACKCENIEFGTYDNYIELTAPPHMKEYMIKRDCHPTTICLDKCVADEVQELWALGISTTGCCCGHNKGPQYPVIAVAVSDIPRMKELGYKVQFNPYRPNDEDSFIPKSIRYED